MLQFQTMRFADPSASVSGLMTNPCKDTTRIRSRLESGGASRNKGLEGKEAKTAARQPQEEAEVPDDREQHVERLDMVQLRIEAMIEASRKWHIDDMSLLFERARGGGDTTRARRRGRIWWWRGTAAVEGSEGQRGEVVGRGGGGGHGRCGTE
jgi:hypothetical protein